MGLTREAILSAADLRTERVAVPEWGGEVFVKALSGSERDAWEVSGIVDPMAEEIERRLDNLRARLLVFAICDEKGAPLFTLRDVEALGAKSAAALDRVYEVAARLNRVSAADVDELAKNSPAGLSAGTG